MSDEARVLFANEAFYLAFSEADEAAMDALWARTAPVCCIHPGWRPLSGRDEVMGSWRGIFGNGSPDYLRARGAKVHLHHDMAMVTCYEQVDESLLAVSNIFVLEEGEWRLCHHHAGACHDSGFELPEEPVASLQ
jgi:hypothetical protein